MSLNQTSLAKEDSGAKSDRERTLLHVTLILQCRLKSTMCYLNPILNSNGAVLHRQGYKMK